MQAQNKQCWDADVATAADDFDGNDDAIDNADKGNDLYVDVHLDNDYHGDLHLGNGSYVDVHLQAMDGTCKFNASNVGATIKSWTDVASGSEPDLQKVAFWVFLTKSNT